MQAFNAHRFGHSLIMNLFCYFSQDNVDAVSQHSRSLFR